MRNLILLLVLLLSPIAVAENSNIELTFGLYTNDKPSTLVKQFSPILRELEDSMSESLNRDVSINIEITKEYDDAIRLLDLGLFDIVRFGPAPYIKAKNKNPNIDIVAVETVKGEKVFYGIIAVHEFSDIETVSDLKGKSFAFGDQGSTIGRFLSQQFLHENGINALNLEDYEYYGRHDLAGKSVADGTSDAGALKENTFDKLVSQGFHIKELSRFENATKPWIVSDQIDDEIKDALTAALININDPEILRLLKISGFVEGGDEDFDKIRDSIDNNQEFFKP